MFCFLFFFDFVFFVFVFGPAGINEFLTERILFEFNTSEDIGEFQNDRYCLFSLFHSEVRSLLLMLWICSEEGKSIWKLALLMYH